MAIRIRGGLETDLDKDKLTPREMAITTDTKKVFAAFAPGEVEQMATVKEMNDAISLVTDDIIQDITEGITEGITQATTNANTATTLANEKAILADTAAQEATTATTACITATTNANTATTNAVSATTSANNAATSANNVANTLANETMKIYKGSVPTYADLATTYPTPQNAWTVTVTDETRSYRYNGTEWVDLGVISSVGTATNTSLGVVKGGGNINVAIDGTMSAPSIGDLTTLNTTNKSNIVNAINELESRPSGGGTATDTTFDNTQSGLSATNVQDAIDEMVSNVGDISTLNTTDKSSTVNAINEVNQKASKLDVLTTTGDMLYFDGTNYNRIPKGTNGQVLTMSTTPTWSDPTGGGSSTDALFKNQLQLMMKAVEGFNSYTNAWSDTFSDTSGINTTLSSGYSFDNTNKSLKAQSGGMDQYVKLMLHADGLNGSTTLIDSSSSPKTFTAYGDAKLSNAQYKFGTASMYFDGAGDYFNTPANADFNFGSGDFTVDFQMRRGSIGTLQSIIGQSDSVPNGSTISFFIRISASNTITAAVYIGSNSHLISSSQAITDTTSWHHIELTRSGTNLYLFIDGVLSGSVSTLSTGIVNSSTYPLTIGRAGDSTTSYFNGYIDELRISKGIARHTTNFTPPISEYSNTAYATVVWNQVISAAILTKAVIEAVQTLGTGTITYYISRDGGTTFTECPLGELTYISSQPSGTSIVPKVVITGNSELHAIAWGGE